MRRAETKALRVVMEINVEGKREKRRSKLRWLDIMVGVYIGDVKNQDEWRYRMRVANPN
jgi:hypothetical protein